ncbi:MAG: hypothetical protein U0360_02410 [Dehalococcoidia bacterium]
MTTSAPAPVIPHHLDGIVEALLGRALAPLEAPTEADFHAAWVARGLSAEEPVVMAVVGGALADRLAWVFLSGYQAVLRRALPRLPVEPGWSALVNTEGVGDLPGTTLEGAPGARNISGWKTWVAAADHVERLVVSASHNALPLVILRRDQPGVTIEHSRSGGPDSYLGELVQGRVHLEGVAVAEDCVVTDERAFPIFRAGEGAYVRVALNAFMLAHGVRLRAPGELISSAVAGLLGAAGAASMPMPSRAGMIAVGAVDARTRDLAAEFEAFIETADPPLRARWERDARMVRSDSLSRRAEDALAALGLVLRQPSSA